MDNDRKTNALKKLQGYIWRDGYASGKLKSQYVEEVTFNGNTVVSSFLRSWVAQRITCCACSIYDDVVSSLQLWKEKGRKICIYSSGSVEAQKLLFGHSIFGDLSEVCFLKCSKEFLHITRELHVGFVFHFSTFPLILILKWAPKLRAKVTLILPICWNVIRRIYCFWPMFWKVFCLIFTYDCDIIVLYKENLQGVCRPPKVLDFI